MAQDVNFGWRVVMDIDVKRLSRDRNYWDSVAPEDANYYSRAEGRFFIGLIRDVGDIPRPQKPEVEWDKDLPDVGAEKQYYNSEMNEVRECVVIAHRHGCAVVEDQDGQSYEAVPPNNFVRTKEQRQREKLARWLNQYMADDLVDEVAADLIAEGWVKNV